jgi:hypothetical protein
MKINMTILALLSLAATAMAGDAEMKQQLVGTWDAYGETIVLKSDGTRITSGTDSSGEKFAVQERWDVRGGNYIEIRTPPEGNRDYTIISLTKHKFVLQDNAHGRHTGVWSRITVAESGSGDQTQDTGQDQSGLQESQGQSPSNNEESPVILKIDRALNDHDWSAFSTYIGNGAVNYFGHKNASVSFIRGDIEQDARTYLWTRAYPKRSTFRHYVREGVIYESVEEQREALEFNGKHHQAHCLLEVSYEDGNPPRLISISLKVLR